LKIRPWIDPAILPAENVVAIGAPVGKPGVDDVGLMDGGREICGLPARMIMTGELAGRYGSFGASLTSPVGIVFTLMVDVSDAENEAMSALAGEATPRSPTRTQAERLAKMEQGIIVVPLVDAMRAARRSQSLLVSAQIVRCRILKHQMI
jgi:hypothetical protein